MLKDNPKIVTIIGFGRVGKSLAFLLSEFTQPLTVNAFDPWLNQGSFEDIAHAYAQNNHRLVQNSSDLLEQSDVIFHCAGPEVPAGQSRLAIVEKSKELTEQIFAPFQLSQTLLIVVSNPVDVIAHHSRKVTNLPSCQVIGTGTLLDTHRFNTLLERELELPSGTSRAIILGEHGDSMVLWRSAAKVGNEAIEDALSPERIDELEKRTKNQAAFIKEHQGATYYGVAHCALTLWKSYLSKTPENLPCSVEVPLELRAKLGITQPIYLSLPVTIGDGKVKTRKPLLSDAEWTDLAHSAHVLEQFCS